MKKLLLVLLVGSTVLFTGCFDILEELYVDKDGTGQYQITFDGSGLMKDGGLRALMQMGAQEAGEDAPDTPFNSEDPIEVDTVMMMSAAPDSIKRKFKHPELLSKMSLRQQISESKETMVTAFVFDFDKVSEINLFIEDMQNMSAGGTDGLSALGMGGGGGFVSAPSSGAPLFVMGKKMLTRAKVEPSEDEVIDEQSMAMMKMMLADATYSTIYNFPGKVKKTTIPNAVVDGKQLKITYDLLEMLEGKVDQSGTIKFKNK